MKKFTWRLFALASFFLFTFSLSAQKQGILKSINKKITENRFIEKASPFEVNNLKSAQPGILPSTITEALTLSFEPKLIEPLLKTNPAVFEMEIPSPKGKTWTMELEPVTLYSDDFILNSTQGNLTSQFEMGMFYRGIIKGNNNSLVSVGFFNGEMQAMIAIDGQNFTLGKLLGKNADNNQYVIYNEGQVPTEFENFCSTQGSDKPVKFQQARGETKDLSKCVNVYFELDYDVFQSKGSVAGASNYISAVFNEVATLYANESIIVKISEIFVWDSPSPYNSSSSSNMLSGFRSTRPSFNGDIGHLVDMNPSNGGVAYVDVLCNTTYNYAYSGIYATYSSVPTYSWTVEVITHEMGHNLGSPHTHDCSWPGGPIDDCYTPSGFCGTGPTPENGGTVMSYCHLTSTGINFNNGFGPLPGDLIRDRVSNAACLTSCDVAGVCSVPSGIASSNVTISSFDVSWNTVSSAVSYDIRIREQGTSTWTNANTSATSYSFTGLTPETTYDVEVQSNCADEESAYSQTANFSTLSDQLVYCESKGNDASYEWIAQVQVGSFSKSSGTASYSDFTSSTISIKKEEATSVTLTPGFASSTYNESWVIWADLNQDGDFADAGEKIYDAPSLTSAAVSGSITFPASALLGETRLRVSMKYNAEQTGPCETFDYGEVEDYTLLIEENIPEPCDAPQGLSIAATSTSSISISWTAAGSNETSFNVQYREAGTTSWSSQTSSGTSATVSGLNHTTSYEFRVRANCVTENSSYSAVVSGTTDTPAPCAAPTNIQSSDVTSNSFTVSWSAVSGAQDYTLEYRAAGASSWTSQSVSGTSANVSGLNQTTTYEVRVKTNCEFESSNYSATISVATTDAPIVYCDSKGNDSSSEWIKQVTFAGINNTSNNNNGYGDYLNLTAQVTAGSSYNFSLVPGFTSWLFGTNTQPEYWRIWIDYNGDGDYTDAGELAYDAGGTSTATRTGSITIPNNVSGTTRMRVSMKNNSAPSSCESFSFGEVEDYSINITPNVPVPCNTPTGLSAINATSSSFDASWNAASGAVSYLVEYRNSGAWSSKTVNGTSTTVSGLQANTSYEVRVSTVCSGETSPVSGIATITTADVDPTPVTYCASQGNSTSDEWIGSISVGSFSKSSGNNSGYADFTSDIISLAKGSSHNISLVPGFSSGWFGSNSYPEYWRVWIDLNQDGDFTDAGELVFDAGGTSTTTVNGSISIPSSALTGNTRMRVSMKYNGAPSSCESFSYGEVEDYTVAIAASMSSLAVNPSETLESILAPNPAMNSISFLNISKTNEAVDAQIIVRDLTGKEISRTEVTTDVYGATRVKINLENQQAGVYLVQCLQSNGTVKTHKLVKR